MIPRDGEIYELNTTATYHPMTEPHEEDSPPVPTMVVGGVRVSAYVDTDGTFRVSVATDEEEPHPAIRFGRGEAGAMAMDIVVNSTRVYMA